jgi:hypothetical protein
VTFKQRGKRKAGQVNRWHSLCKGTAIKREHGAGVGLVFIAGDHRVVIHCQGGQIDPESNVNNFKVILASTCLAHTQQVTRLLYLQNNSLSI